MPRPGPEAYPSIPNLWPAPCRNRACVKCKQATDVGYTDGHRIWPCCLRCAWRAAAIPCASCGDTTPYHQSWEPYGDRPGGSIAYHHESGAVCFPLRVDATYRLPCSSCGAPMRVTLRVLPERIAAGVTDRLACACGAAWKLEGMRPELNVYLVA